MKCSIPGFLSRLWQGSRSGSAYTQAQMRLVWEGSMADLKPAFTVGDFHHSPTLKHWSFPRSKGIEGARLYLKETLLDYDPPNVECGICGFHVDKRTATVAFGSKPERWYHTECTGKFLAPSPAPPTAPAGSVAGSGRQFGGSQMGLECPDCSIGTCKLVAHGIVPWPPTGTSTPRAPGL